MSAAIVAGFFIHSHWDKNVRFFRGADTFRLHYMVHKDDFGALAEQVELGQPLGQNSLCLKASCIAEKANEPPLISGSSTLDAQLATYAPLIENIGLPKGWFLFMLPDGALNTVPLSFVTQGFIVNSTLHYSAEEDTGLEVCGNAPSGESHGSCAMPLNNGWIIKYQWLPEAVWPDPVRDNPGSLDAKCEAKKNESFKAYTECVKNTPGQFSEPACDPEKLSPEQFDQCIDDVIAGRKLN